MPDSEDKTDLAASFRQTRRELWVMLAAWIVFAAWTIGYNATHAFTEEASLPDPVLGMPRWITFGIFTPWMVAVVLTTWFAMRFMKDTPLHDGAPETEAEREGK
jgi:hypothetical protein